MSSYALHPAVLDDLVEVWAFIASDKPEAADRVLAEIWAVFPSLAASPGMGFSRRAYTSLPIRFFPVGRYLVAYRVVFGGVEILAVVHGQRSPRVIAGLVRGRRES